MQASAGREVGNAERDVLGQAQQQQEEDRQRQSDQQVLDRVDRHLADGLEHEEADEGQQHEQQAVLAGAVDLRIQDPPVRPATARSHPWPRLSPNQPSRYCACALLASEDTSHSALEAVVVDAWRTRQEIAVELRMRPRRRDRTMRLLSASGVTCSASVPRSAKANCSGKARRPSTIADSGQQRVHAGLVAAELALQHRQRRRAHPQASVCRTGRARRRCRCPAMACPRCADARDRRRECARRSSRPARPAIRTRAPGAGRACGSTAATCPAASSSSGSTASDPRPWSAACARRLARRFPRPRPARRYGTTSTGPATSCARA